MKKSALLIVIFCLTLLLLTSCETKKKEKTFISFIGGTEGISANFAKDNPPEKVLEAGSEPFFITLTLSNKGEYTIKPDEAFVTLEGISYSSFQIKAPTARSKILIEGKSLDDNKEITGGQEEITFEANFKDDIPASQEYPINANFCYKYQTNVAADICLRKDMTRRSKTNDVCEIREEKKVANSGSPVQVEMLTEKPSAQHEAYINFNIKNKGQGEVYTPEFVSNKDCISNEEKINLVFVEVLTTDKLPIKCQKMSNSNKGLVRLVAGETTISCQLDTSQLQDTTFKSGLFITLSYVYKNTISKKLIVENIA